MRNRRSGRNSFAFDLENVLANSGLVRFSAMADLLRATVFVFLI
jgi:hypothetical protein